MKRTFLLLLLFIGSLSAGAQTAASYSFSSFAGTYTANQGGTAVNILADDITQTGIPLGFSFNFCGTPYNTVSICSNGWISFGNVSTNQLTNDITTLGTIVPAVMPLWDDLSGSGGPSATYTTSGISPNRVFTMEWSQWKWNYSGSTDVISIQAKLYETTGVIQFIYSQGANAPNIPSATIGIANTATDYQTLNNSTAAPTSSSTTFTTSIASKPATGQVYQWTPPPPCSGTPVVTAAGPTTACPNVPFTLTSSVGTSASNLSYQWQSSPGGANTWTNITGATSANYNSPGITVATDFRVLVSCGTNTGTSNVIAITMNTFVNCYCNGSFATSTVDDDIGQVVVGSFANPVAAPTPLTSNPSSTGTYSNFTALGPIVLLAGATVPLNVTQINSSSSYYTCYLKVYIDYDHDGQFISPGENVYGASGPSAAASPTFSGTFVVPTTALTGLTRMRFVLVESGTAASVTPCSSYTWGETEDYTVNILTPTPPAPAVTTNSPLCPGPGQTLTITATSSYPNPTFTLTGPGISTITSATGIFTIPNVTTANGGTFSVTTTSNGFTSAAATTTVVVYPSPALTVTNITSPTACGGTDGSFQLNGLAASTTYTLNYRRNNVQQPASSITSTAAGTYVVGGLIAATYDSIRLVTSNGCVSNTVGPIIVTAPSAPATPAPVFNAPICNNSTLLLSVPAPNPAGTYTWIGPAGFTANGPNATRPGMIPAWSGVYSVTLTISGCVSNPGNLNVVVNPPDAPPVPNNVTYCQFDNALPLTAAGTNLMWYSAATGGTGTTAAPVPSTAVAPATLTFYVSQAAVCESPRAALTVTVKPKPAPPTVSSTTVSFCQYQPAPTLSASGTSVKWYTTPTGGFGSATPPTVATPVPGTFFYYVTQTVNGCESDRQQITVIVNPKPAPPVVQSPLNLCQGDVVALSAGGQGIRWYTSPTGPGGVSTPIIPNTGYEDSFFYYATQTVVGCESDRSLLRVVVNYKPNGIIVTARPAICQGDVDSFFYYGNARVDAVYSWKSPQPQTSVVGGGGQGPFIVRFNTGGQEHVELTVNNKGCISTLISQLVNVKPSPVVTFVAKSEACVGEIINISLNGITPLVSTYGWDFAGGFQEYGAADGGPFGIRYTTAGTKVISVVATAKGCDSRKLTDTVVVHPLPKAAITILSDGGGQEVCGGDSVHLSVEDGGVGDRYKWSPFQFLFPGSDTTSSVWVRPTDTRYVRVDVTSDVTGCKGSDSVLLSAKPCCSVYFPNVFSPNGDGRNDLFRVITQGHHVVESFRVIDRWGQVVFETRDEKRGWDGTYNGKAQDMGTYYYYIKYKCATGESLEQKGEVLLMR